MGAQTLQEIVEIDVESLSGGAPICATVSDAVVTLTGAVQDGGRRPLIEQELLQLPEVLDVHNHLHVALLEREDVSTAGMKIEAEDDAVALSGQAASWFARDAVERLTWTLPGVRTVENRITLPPDEVEPNAEGA